jgi:hypothetical protein
MPYRYSLTLCSDRVFSRFAVGAAMRVCRRERAVFARVAGKLESTILAMTC